MVSDTVDPAGITTRPLPSEILSLTPACTVAPVRSVRELTPRSMVAAMRVPLESVRSDDLPRDRSCGRSRRRRRQRCLVVEWVVVAPRRRSPLAGAQPRPGPGRPSARNRRMRRCMRPRQARALLPMAIVFALALLNVPKTAARTIVQSCEAVATPNEGCALWARAESLIPRIRGALKTWITPRDRGICRATRARRALTSRVPLSRRGPPPAQADSQSAAGVPSTGYMGSCASLYENVASYLPFTISTGFFMRGTKSALVSTRLRFAQGRTRRRGRLPCAIDLAPTLRRLPPWPRRR